MAGSDETSRARLQIADDLGRLEAARQQLAKMLVQVADVDARTVKPHLCHICGVKVREKE